MANSMWITTEINHKHEQAQRDNGIFLHSPTCSVVELATVAFTCAVYWGRTSHHLYSVPFGGMYRLVEALTAMRWRHPGDKDCCSKAQLALAQAFACKTCLVPGAVLKLWQNKLQRLSRKARLAAAAASPSNTVAMHASAATLQGRGLPVNEQSERVFGYVFMPPGRAGSLKRTATATYQESLLTRTVSATAPSICGTCGVLAQSMPCRPPGVLTKPL